MPTPPAAEVARTSRSGQSALAAFLVLLLGLLIYRGYGSGLGVRPTEAAGPRYDLNRADRADFEQIPGVGPKLAQAIVDHRDARGQFQSVDQLREVKGMGPATFDKVRPYLRAESTGLTSRGPPASLADLDPLILERKKPASDPSGRSSRIVSSSHRKLQPGDPPINVNTASFEELLRLPDVGPVTARAILAARNERPFQMVDDLDRVRGIGVKRLRKLRPFVKVQ